MVEEDPAACEEQVGWPEPSRKMQHQFSACWLAENLSNILPKGTYNYQAEVKSRLVYPYKRVDNVLDSIRRDNTGAGCLLENAIKRCTPHNKLRKGNNPRIEGGERHRSDQPVIGTHPAVPLTPDKSGRKSRGYTYIAINGMQARPPTLQQAHEQA
jgi:hypothetical protein